MVESLIDKKYIFSQLDIDSFEQLIAKISLPFIKDGIVTTDYAEQVIAREAVFPTGLPTEPVGVAIPHTDPAYVNENRVAIATLKNPITMKEMGAIDDKEVEVYIVFLLALGESNKQLNILQKLIGAFRNQKLLEKLQVADVDDMLYLAQAQMGL